MSTTNDGHTNFDEKEATEIMQITQKVYAFYDHFSNEHPDFNPKTVTTTILKIAMSYVYQSAPEIDMAYGGIMEMNERFQKLAKEIKSLCKEAENGN